MSNKPAVIKEETGRLQRSDVKLDKEIAATLLQRIFAGETLYPPEGYITIQREGGEPEQLKHKTIQKWVERNNVIPETGRTLREVLDEARIEYRSKKREERQEMMIQEAEAAMHRTLRVRTNVPVIGMFGVIKDEEGNVVRKENAGLLKIKMDTAQFITERLDPKYAKKEQGTHKHLVFSLSDLRKYREGQQ